MMGHVRSLCPTKIKSQTTCWQHFRLFCECVTMRTICCIVVVWLNWLIWLSSQFKHTISLTLWRGQSMAINYTSKHVYNRIKISIRMPDTIQTILHIICTCVYIYICATFHADHNMCLWPVILCACELPYITCAHDLSYITCNHDLLYITCAHDLIKFKFAMPKLNNY